MRAETKAPLGWSGATSMPRRARGILFLQETRNRSQGSIEGASACLQEIAEQLPAVEQAIEQELFALTTRG